MNEGHGDNDGGNPRAPWDDPALYARLCQEQECNRYRDGGQHATSSKAPEALDLCLLVPVLACWAGTGWVVGCEVANAWRQVLLLASGCTVLAALPVVAVLRFRPPRHRADPCPGAPEHDLGATGTLSVSLLMCALCAAAVLTISAAHLRVHQRNPLTAVVTSGQPVILIGTASQQPRVPATSRSTLVVTTLDAAQVDTRASILSVTVLGNIQWLSLPMGTRIRMRTRLRPTKVGRTEAAAIPKHVGLTALDLPNGIFGVVTSVRAGPVQAVGAPGIGASGVVGAGEGTGLWLPGVRSLVPGVALGDDHALPAPSCEDMRTVSMTRLTAVSGQYVAIILGLGLEALGVLSRRRRALPGAAMFTLLVILVRPSGSVLRAVTIGAVMPLGVVAGRRAASVPVLCAGAIVLLLIGPWQSRDYSFTLSAAATAGIVIGSEPIAAHLSRRLPRWPAAAVVLPLAAQTACGPILILFQSLMEV